MKEIPNHLFFAWAEEEIAQGRCIRIRMRGISMRPFLREGKDEITIAPCRPDRLKRLDVILFRYKGRHLVHRIVNIDGGLYTLQGDGVWASQEQCHAHDIVGKMTTIHRPSGKTIAVTSRTWRTYSRLWHTLRPFRQWMLRILRHTWWWQEREKG